MTCIACAWSIEKAIKRLPRICEAVVDVLNGRAQVIFFPNFINVILNNLFHFFKIKNYIYFLIFLIVSGPRIFFSLQKKITLWDFNFKFKQHLKLWFEAKKRKKKKDVLGIHQRVSFCYFFNLIFGNRLCYLSNIY